jgi:hypothetical protein
LQQWFPSRNLKKKEKQTKKYVPGIIQRSSDFCYLGSTVVENGGTSREVSARIRKVRGSFSKLRSVWLSKSLRKDTKIRLFNACVKSVLLYGCETWLVTKEIQRKIETFVNRCLRYIFRIWWPNIISDKDLWKVTGQEDINVEIRNRKFRWIGHTLTLWRRNYFFNFSTFCI